MQQWLHLAEVKNNILVDKTLRLFFLSHLAASVWMIQEASFPEGGQALCVETGQDICSANEVK